MPLKDTLEKGAAMLRAGEVRNKDGASAGAAPEQRAPSLVAAASTGWETVWTHEELKSFAGAKCLDIFNDLTEQEACAMPNSVRQAWMIGRCIAAKSPNT